MVTQIQEKKLITQALIIVMETAFKINWEETCLVQNKLKCLEGDLGEKADFAGALLEAHSFQTRVCEPGW